MSRAASSGDVYDVYIRLFEELLTLATLVLSHHDGSHDVAPPKARGRSLAWLNSEGFERGQNGSRK